MDEHEVIIAELVGARERAVALIKAKLEAVAHQVEENSARTMAEIGAVLPPDLEALFSLGGMPERLAGLTRPVLAATPTLDCLRSLDRGRAQSEVLQELLRQLEPWSGPRAIVVFREGFVVGWSGAGFTEEDPVRGWRGAVSESPAFRKVSEGLPVRVAIGDDRLLSGWLPVADGAAIIVPLSLRGKVVGGLLALGAERPVIAETVQLLAFLTGLLLETLTVRPTAPTPALLDPVEIRAEEAPAAEEVVLEELPQARPVPAPTPQPVPVAVPLPTAPTPVAAPVVAQVAATPVVAAPPVEAAAMPAPVEPDVPVAEDATATVQLKVPVAPARTPEEDRKHEEARRFARLLVSEIRLYNEQAVQDGRAAGDIYHRLKEDIDRSREMYEQRVPADVRAGSNYFYDELVRILADGESDALGL
jgi:hypothetical protein